MGSYVYFVQVGTTPIGPHADWRLVHVANRLEWRLGRWVTPRGVAGLAVGAPCGPLMRAAIASELGIDPACWLVREQWPVSSQAA